MLSTAQAATEGLHALEYMRELRDPWEDTTMLMARRHLDCIR